MVTVYFRIIVAVDNVIQRSESTSISTATLHRCTQLIVRDIIVLLDC